MVGLLHLKKRGRTDLYICITVKNRQSTKKKSSTSKKRLNVMFLLLKWEPTTENDRNINACIPKMSFCSYLPVFCIFHYSIKQVVCTVTLERTCSPEGPCCPSAARTNRSSSIRCFGACVRLTAAGVGIITDASCQQVWWGFAWPQLLFFSKSVNLMKLGIKLAHACFISGDGSFLKQKALLPMKVKVKTIMSLT